MRVHFLLASVSAFSLSALSCKTINPEPYLLETRPYFCTATLKVEAEADATSASHCPPSEGKGLEIVQGTSTIYLTWPVSRSNREQSLELKSCQITERGSGLERGSCEIAAPQFDALIRGERAYYTSPVTLPPLPPGSYSLAALFSGSAGIVPILSFLEVR